MVHNGIEYGIMAAYAEGFNILRARQHRQAARESDAETTPLREPGASTSTTSTCGHRRGLAAGQRDRVLAARPDGGSALVESPDLAEFAGRVSDSARAAGPITAAIDEGVPAPVLSAALFERFSSRGEADFADKLLSAMRFQFGGHLEKSG